MDDSRKSRTPASAEPFAPSTRRLGDSVYLFSRLIYRHRIYLLSLALLCATFPPLNALPVPLGEIIIGLESYDGYQEGKALISTDEQGRTLEILIAYKGFGLDTVSWTLDNRELVTLREATDSAAWWRSRLLERKITQEVLQNVAEIQSSLLYRYRSGNYPFDATIQTLRFVRQGNDYALILLENSTGASMRTYEKKSLPIFTIHFIGNQLPILRNMLSTEKMNQVLEEFAAEKATIEAIISSGPGSS